MDLIKASFAPLNFTPLEQCLLPPTLDGSVGSNRQRDSGCQIAATNDRAAIVTWLSTVADSPQTFRSYRKEAERLLLWAVYARSIPLSGLQLEDMEAYKTFLSAPSSSWSGKRQPRTSPDWRPFERGLQPSSINQALVILGTLFSFLVKAGYLNNNPMQLMSRKRLRSIIQPSATVERYLEHDVWEFLWDYICNRLPATTPRQHAVAERTRFLFALLYLQSPRVSEVANHTMAAFIQRRGTWWWNIVGKGEKSALIPVKKDMMLALARYRRHLQHPPFPIAGETTPLLCSLHGTKPISADMVYRIVKATVAGAADKLNTIDPGKAKRLRASSTHWFRHTSLTHQADMGIDLRYLKASARHASIQTTQRYLHTEEEEWHIQMDKHNLTP